MRKFHYYRYPNDINNVSSVDNYKKVSFDKKCFKYLISYMKKITIMHKAYKNEQIVKINQLLQKCNKSGMKSYSSIKKDLIANQCTMKNIEN